MGNLSSWKWNLGIPRMLNSVNHQPNCQGCSFVTLRLQMSCRSYSQIRHWFASVNLRYSQPSTTPPCQLLWACFPIFTCCLRRWLWVTCWKRLIFADMCYKPRHVTLYRLNCTAKKKRQKYLQHRASVPCLKKPSHQNQSSISKLMLTIYSGSLQSKKLQLKNQTYHQPHRLSSFPSKQYSNRSRSRKDYRKW